MKHLKTYVFFCLVIFLLVGCGASTNPANNPEDSKTEDNSQSNNQTGQTEQPSPPDTSTSTSADRTNQILLPVLWFKWLKPNDPNDTSSISSLDMYLYDLETQNLATLFTHGEKDWFSVQDIYGSQAIWSPDKQQIAFMDGYQSDLYNQLYVINADGSELKQLTDDSEDLYINQIQWTPDGKQIVFGYQLWSTQENSIAMIDVNSGGLTIITQDVFGDQYNPAISPDGQRVAFTSGENNAVYLIDLNGENPQQITGEMVTTNLPVWHPNSEWLLYYGEDKNAYWYDLSSGESTLFIEQDEENIDYKENFAFSPDGAKLAYTSYYIEMADIGPIKGEGRIHIFDLTSGEIVVIAENKGTGVNDAFPVWSPDSSKLLFHHWWTEYDGYSETTFVELYLVNADGSGLTRLLENIEVPGIPDW